MINLLNIFKFGSPAAEVLTAEVVEAGESDISKSPEKNTVNMFGGGAPVVSFSFDGTAANSVQEPIIDYVPDYCALAQRSWEAYYSSDLCQLVINNDLRWVIGAGLTLKAIPNEIVLKQFGIQFSDDAFPEIVENFFKVIKKSKKASYDENQNLDELFYQARLIKLLSGDCLYIYRIKDGFTNCQIIDGRNIWCHKKEHNGNRIIHGVEINSTCKHIAYWVKVANQFKAQRVEAYTKDGLQLVYIGYASRYRIDSVRGMPILSAMLQTVTSITDYRSATLGAAKEREKMAIVVEHNSSSTGEDIMEPSVSARASNWGLEGGEDPVGYNGYALPPHLASKIAKTTEKTTVNLPVGASIKAIEGKNNLYFKDFFRENFGVLCAAVGGQPPEVVLQKFEGSFSSSRMGGEMWNHNKNFLIEMEVVASYRPFVNIQTELLARNGIIKDTGYLAALHTNWLTKEAANRNAFIGKPVPHIDPSKEVKAERAALGAAFDNMPLTTPEDAAERLDLGDLRTNIVKAGVEFQKATKIFGLPQSLQNNNTEVPKNG